MADSLMTPGQRTSQTLGIGLWAVGMGLGFLIEFYMLIVSPIMSGRSVAVTMLFLGAVIAIPACFIYLVVPLLIDRFEPEPWWTLAMAFLWGAVGAGGFSLLINTVMGGIGSAVGGKLGAMIFGGIISAPITEELTKGLAPLGVFLFMRRHFDGKVDGFIYASFSGLGFAVMENSLYYGRGLATGDFWHQFIIRGMLRPWNHAFYCAMFGIGLGIARETTKTWVKWAAPLGGLFIGMSLHGFWNAHGLILAFMGITPGLWSQLVLTGFYFVVVLLMVGTIIYFVVREGKIIRAHLEDEVLIGNLSQADVDLTVHPFGRYKARFGPGGKLAHELVLAVTRLAMTKWHAGRAYQGRVYTVSMDAVVPLRQEVIRIRQQLYAGARR
jgi:RsiW-degrading membrane proteinase PrsW (M82 family)